MEKQIQFNLTLSFAIPGSGNRDLCRGLYCFADYTFWEFNLAGIITILKKQSANIRDNLLFNKHIFSA
jgi:hypothetical protein